MYETELLMDNANQLHIAQERVKELVNFNFKLVTATDTVRDMFRAADFDPDVDAWVVPQSVFDAILNAFAELDKEAAL